MPRVRKGLVWPCRAIQYLINWSLIYIYWYIYLIHLKYRAPAHTACSCFAAHESNPAAELAMSSSVLLWHSWRYYSGTSQTWLYFLFPNKLKGWPFPHFMGWEARREKESWRIHGYGDSVTGHAKGFSFSMLQLSWLCCHCDCSGFQVRPLCPKSDTQNTGTLK